MGQTEFILTADGSHSLLNSALNETYHSRHGAVQESMHVFIRSGFEYVAAQKKEGTVAIFEVGFGTGLNAFLTLQQALAGGHDVHYTSLESYPLGEDIWTQLNYADKSTPGLKDYFSKIHQAPWNVPHTVLANFTLHKLHTTLQEAVLESGRYDLIYFDAFAPNKQPEMWTKEMLHKVAESMGGGAVFVTYCAKGQLKRDLRELGLHVETLAGPPGKKEMIRAAKR